MTDVKKTTRKATSKATPKRTAAKAPVKRASTPRPKKGPKIVRNLRGITVHVRLEHPTREKPYRIELKPRGVPGDCHIVPVELQGAMGYSGNVGLLFEIITETEYRRIQSEYPQVGYTPRRETPVIVREEDTRIASFPDWDGKRGTRPPERTAQDRQNPEAVAAHPRQGENVGPVYADVPGSARGLHAQLRGGEAETAESAPQQGALPPGMKFDRSERIVMTRQRT